MAGTIIVTLTPYDDPNVATHPAYKVPVATITIFYATAKAGDATAASLQKTYDYRPVNAPTRTIDP
ncbi:MAG: hypothetical protein KF726_26495, partial [Anaerolineae bacterium]|nr:hypothetical protein [Anaerolineae bacterium]